NILKDNLQPVALHVADISGGCGAMFSVYVASPQFEGVSMVKQHRMVYDLLREEIPAMHGLSLQTSKLSCALIDDGNPSLSPNPILDTFSHTHHTLMYIYRDPSRIRKGKGGADKV